MQTQSVHIWYKPNALHIRTTSFSVPLPPWGRGGAHIPYQVVTNRGTNILAISLVPGISEGPRDDCYEPVLISLQGYSIRILGCVEEQHLPRKTSLRETQQQNVPYVGLYGALHTYSYLGHNNPRKKDQPYKPSKDTPHPQQRV